MSTKTCSKCQLDLTTDKFGKDASRSDGLRYWCRDCYAVRKRERYKASGKFAGRHIQMRDSDWTASNVAWIAGILEGEGSFTRNTSGLPIISVQMTDKDVLDRIALITGVGRVNGPYTPKQSHWKPVYQWQVRNHKHAIGIMWLVYGWLCERRRQRVDELVREWSRGTSDNG